MPLHAYLRCQIDLIFKEFIKPQESTWETFWSSRRPSGSPQEAPRKPLGDLTSTSHRPHIDQTSTKHRPIIDIASNRNHRTHVDLTSSSHRTRREQHLYTNVLSGVELPISRLRRPYVNNNNNTMTCLLNHNISSLLDA